MSAAAGVAPEDDGPDESSSDEDAPEIKRTPEELKALEDEEIKKLYVFWRDSITGFVLPDVKDVKEVEKYVKRLCNATANIYVERKEWDRTSRHNLDENIGTIITKKWKELVAVAHVDVTLRNRMLDRCVTGAPEAEKNNFYQLADDYLPMVL